MKASMVLVAAIIISLFSNSYLTARAQQEPNPAQAQQGAATETPGSPQAAAPTANDIERDKLELERRKHRDTIAMERKAVRALSLSIVIPLLVVIGAIGFGIWMLNRQASRAAKIRQQAMQSDFELRLAKIVLNASDPLERHNRAITLQSLFRHRVPEDFPIHFNPSKGGPIDSR